MTNYEFTFRLIARKFLRSLVTNHGTWDMREAIILRLRDATGRVGWGEIAPISWFGSETLAQALDFCRQLPTKITADTIFSIPDSLPACQFGFETAWEELGTRGQGDKETRGKGENTCLDSFPPSPPLTYSALLPTGEAALSEWQSLWQEGYRTFKWKIGVADITQEMKIFDLLTHKLPASAKLRLDANGGLSAEEAKSWLQNCDDLQKNQELPIEIEFIEQPLPVEQFSQMLALSKSYRTAIALDESVATLQQLVACYERGWRGVFVIKPAIAGSPSRLRQFCQQQEIDVVFSSVLETAIARLAALKLAAELSRNNRAVGFGVNHFFAPEDENWLENLWNNP
ncbi:o-succinylbenzoate synthase [Nostoc sp. TCL26-01]|nr:o-succinylbenzoate synthase [Nostoc sp. TCL26-01]